VWFSALSTVCSHLSFQRYSKQLPGILAEGAS
jgi:hypothetical protein